MQSNHICEAIDRGEGERETYNHVKSIECIQKTFKCTVCRIGIRATRKKKTEKYSKFGTCVLTYRIRFKQNSSRRTKMRTDFSIQII